MDVVLSTKAAILQALTDGPHYGRELIRTLKEKARGMVNPLPGTIYRAFDALVRGGYLRSWSVVPGGARGARSRRYYELTSRGVAAAERQRRSLVELLGMNASDRSEGEARLMARRLRRTAEVSAAALQPPRPAGPPKRRP